MSVLQRKLKLFAIFWFTRIHAIHFDAKGSSIEVTFMTQQDWLMFSLLPLGKGQEVIRYTHIQSLDRAIARYHPSSLPFLLHNWTKLPRENLIMGDQASMNYRHTVYPWDCQLAYTLAAKWVCIRMYLLHRAVYSRGKAVYYAIGDIYRVSSGPKFLRGKQKEGLD